MRLPPLPPHRSKLVAERLEGDASAFLRVRRLTLVVEYEDGTTSAPFAYDVVDRSRLDAVVIAAHFRGADGRRRVFLRSALRPPVWARPPEARPVPERDTVGALWELPAGLVEEDERSPSGLKRCAARELHEELGLRVDASALEALGPSAFPVPGMIGERHFYFHVEVDPARREVPPEDGSALERAASVIDVALEDALAAARAGEIEDAKTELALRRLAEL